MKKYSKAVECLTKDREPLLAFYDFPAEHWVHLRTGSPVESVVAAARHSRVRTKGCLSHGTAMVVVFKLITAAVRTRRKRKGSNQLPQIIEGVKSTDGIEVTETDQHAAA